MGNAIKKGRQTKKGLRTRKRLAIALEECLLEKPLPQIRVYEVTNLCGVNRLTLYYHFADIYDLFSWTYRRRLNQYFSPREGTRSWQKSVADILKHAEKNRNFYLALLGSSYRQEFQAYLEERFFPLLEARPAPGGAQPLSDGEQQMFRVRCHAVMFISELEQRVCYGHSASPPVFDLLF